MSFAFNKETRRSLRERIRDGINLIPGASTVVQAPGNILNSATGVVVGEKRGGLQQPQQKSHSVDATSSLLHLQEPSGGTASIISKSEQSVVTASSTSYTPGASLQPISPSYLTADNSNPGGGEGDGSRSESVSSCSSSTSSSPSKYRTYVVKPNDTVTSIAASFDCTPSELMRVNRLITARVLFPGQVLKIPNKPKLTNQQSQPNQNIPCQQQQSSQNISSQINDPAAANIIESITYAQRKFLKIKVRHVTDGNGVVTGILLITPNAVMFDPNVSDPLVIEQGAETYGIIVPIEYIVGASIWSDICGMRVRGKEAFVPPGPRPVLWGEETKDNKTEEDKGSGVAGGGGIEDKIEEEKVEKLEDEDKPASILENKSENTEEELKEKESLEGDTSNSKCAAPTATPPPSPSKLQQVTEHPLKEVDSVATSDKQDDNASAAVSTWYFCLTIGRPKPGESGVSAPGADMIKSSRRAPFCVTYGQKNVVRPEFWFSVGKEQVPELYKYWMFWWPNIYGEVDFKAISDRGYDPIDWDNLSVLPDFGNNNATGGTAGGGGTRNARNSNGEEGNGEEQTMAQELNELTKESWEVVTNEELRNLLAMGGDEMMAISLPELIGGKSEILEEEDIKNITRHLTARAEGYPWTLIFSSSRDGFSLNSLYRRNSLMQEDSPVMMIVQDTNSRVFGALVSCSLHTSDSFYGTGQSFLFTLRPEFNVYKWTGENLFFVKGNLDGFWIGAGDGKFGLYVDGDLNCGRTETCQTYGNPPLTEPQDFIIKTLECWAFGNYVLGNDLIATAEACK